jgi:[ribosomal protein S5]-alanine N-acetyltransferase
MNLRPGVRPNPPLHGPRLHLEPLAPRHAAAMFAVIADPALYTYIDQGPPASAEHLRSVYRRLQARQSDDGSERWLNWVLFGPDSASATPLGYVQASVLADGRSWVAYLLTRSAWGRGYATEAMQAVLQHLFGTLQVRQAMAQLEQDNARSIALVRRLGFRRATGDDLAGHTLTATEQLWLLDAAPRPLGKHAQGREPAE